MASTFCWGDTICGDDATHEGYWTLQELAFVELKPQPVIVQATENGVQVLDMLRIIVTRDKDVVLIIMSVVRWKITGNDTIASSM